MWRTIMVLAFIAIVGCAKTASEPEPKVDPADTQKRAADRDRVINQGNKAQ